MEVMELTEVPIYANKLPHILTLIQPGKEVKVDLANFDVKFWTKLLYVVFI